MKIIDNLVPLKIKLGSKINEPRETYPADEAVRMPLAVERGYIILHNSAIAAAAFGREHVEIILATVRLAVPLVEAFLAELFAALGAEEVLSMPSLLQSRHAFLKKKDGSHFQNL